MSVDEEIERLRAAGSLKWTLWADTIGAWVAESDLGTAPAVTAALHGAVDRGLLGYPPQWALTALQQACAAFVDRRYGWSVPAERIGVIADAVTGLELAISTFSRPGSAVVVPTPIYPPFLEVVREAGRPLVELPLLEGPDGWRLDLDGLRAAFRAGAGLLLLCQPHNPVGAVFPADHLAEVADLVAEFDGRVCSDEVHGPLVYRGAAHVPYATVSTVAAGHSISVVSASKAWNIPGTKCAQLVINSDADRPIWSRIGVEAGVRSGVLGIVASTAAYTDGVGWLDDTLETLRKHRDLLHRLLSEQLPAVRARVPEATYLSWWDCTDLALPGGAADFFARRARVQVEDGRRFAAPADRDAIRFNFALPEPVLIEAIARIADAVSR
jgi:cysteine-S-conjugate beta-lyase